MQEPQNIPLHSPVASDAATDRSRFDQWLLVVVGLLLVTFIGAALSLVIYVLSMRSAPRTAIEQQLKVDQVAAREHPGDVQNWARLALSEAHAKRWNEALDAIRQGRRVKPAAILDVVEARVLWLKSDRAALAAYDKAIVSARTEMVDQTQKYHEMGVSMPASGDLLFEAMWGRMRVLERGGRVREALAQAKEAQRYAPTDAEVHAKVGQLMLRCGDKEGARAQFEAALEFVPDLQSARDGLKQLGEGN